MPHCRRTFLLVAALLGALGLPAGTTDGAPRRLAAPHRLFAAAPLPAATAHHAAVGVIRARTRGWYTARTGSVAVVVSPSYDDPEAAAARWGEFIERLVHGDELAGVHVYLATGGEVWTMCGLGASGCYAPDDDLIVSVGDGSDGIRPEAVVAHEYGHHVAASRNNAPWRALDWGTKRWATAVGVCAGAKQHEMYPMDEGEHYDLNPGEGFAETYRVLNAQPLTDEGDDWSIVSALFRPNARLLEAARRDVLVPWNGPAAVRLTGRIGSDGTARVRVKTPLDGTLEYRLTGATAAGATSGRRTVCGSRSTALALRGRPGARYVLTALRP